MLVIVEVRFLESVTSDKLRVEVSNYIRMYPINCQSVKEYPRYWDLRWVLFSLIHVFLQEIKQHHGRWNMNAYHYFV